MGDIKLKVRPQFPIQIFAQNGIALDKAGGRWTFAIDYSALAVRSPYTPGPNDRLLVFNATTGQFQTVQSASLHRAIVTTPSPLTVSVGATVGTVVGTLSVLNGIGSYTFTLTSNPGGKYSISGNQLNVAASLTVGTDTITIHADNGAGDTLNLTTTVRVTSLITYVPTYYLYGF